VGNLNSHGNGFRTTAARISTSFVRCIKGGLCRSRSTNTSRRRWPSRQILRPKPQTRSCLSCMFWFVRKGPTSHHHHRNSIVIALCICINQTSNSLCLIPIKLILLDLIELCFLNSLHLLDCLNRKSATHGARIFFSHVSFYVIYTSSTSNGLRHIVIYLLTTSMPSRNESQSSKPLPKLATRLGVPQACSPA
jgi:hypothetical protein